MSPYIQYPTSLLARAIHKTWQPVLRHSCRQWGHLCASSNITVSFSNLPAAWTKDLSIAKYTILFSSLATSDHQITWRSMLWLSIPRGFVFSYILRLSSFFHIPMSDSCITADDIKVYCHCHYLSHWDCVTGLTVAEAQPFATWRE